MAPSAVTRVRVSDLLFASSKHGQDQLRTQLTDGAGLRRFTAHFDSDEMADQIVRALLGLLSEPVGDVLTFGWTTLGNVKTACEHTRDDAGSRECVSLGSHTLSSVQRPLVVIDVEGVEQPLFELELAVDVTTDWAELDIANGVIESFSLGRLSSTARLTSGEWLQVSYEIIDFDFREPAIPLARA